MIDLRCMVVCILLAVIVYDANAEDATNGVTSVNSATSEVEAPSLAIGALRDPFWPVGWTPPKEVREEKIVDAEVRKAPVKWDEAMNGIQMSGLSKSLDGKFIAILKGIGVVEEGDLVSVKHENLIYRWRIKTITADGIQPERVGVFVQTLK